MAFSWIPEFHLLLCREILWHEEEPVQRSFRDLQDLPQQDDQTVWVSQSGRGNICLSCSVSQGGNRELIPLRRRWKYSVWSESQQTLLLWFHINSLESHPPPQTHTFSNHSEDFNPHRESSPICWGLLQTRVTLGDWFTVPIFEFNLTADQCPGSSSPKSSESLFCI